MISATLVVLPTRWLGLDGPAAVALTIATTYRRLRAPDP
jgi:hypothetical protein